MERRFARLTRCREASPMLYLALASNCSLYGPAQSPTHHIGSIQARDTNVFLRNDHVEMTYLDWRQLKWCDTSSTS